MFPTTLYKNIQRNAPVSLLIMCTINPSLPMNSRTDPTYSAPRKSPPNRHCTPYYTPYSHPAQGHLHSPTCYRNLHTFRQRKFPQHLKKRKAQHSWEREGGAKTHSIQQSTPRPQACSPHAGTDPGRPRRSACPARSGSSAPTSACAPTRYPYSSRGRSTSWPPWRRTSSARPTRSSCSLAAPRQWSTRDRRRLRSGRDRVGSGRRRSRRCCRRRPCCTRHCRLGPARRRSRAGCRSLGAGLLVMGLRAGSRGWGGEGRGGEERGWRLQHSSAYSTPASV